MSQGREILSAAFAPEARADPYPLFHAVREASPFVVDDSVAVFGRYEHCEALLRDPRTSSDPGRSRVVDAARAKGAFTPQLSFLAGDHRAFVFRDPPDHTRLRRLVSKAFSPRMVASLRPRIEQIVDELLSDAARRRSLDVVNDFGFPLSVRTISELLGVPPEDRDRFRDWSRPLFRTVDALEGFVRGTAVDADPEVTEATGQLVTYFRRLVAARRTEPTDDLLGRLVGVEEAGDRLTEGELVATAMLLLTAGYETVVQLIAGAMVALLRNPDQYAALKDDPQLAAGAVEEALRFDPPSQILLWRVATEPVAIEDVEVLAGSLLFLVLAAANRDPEVFPDPDTFAITRPNADRHLAFAAGPHFCLGAGLARLEGTVALTALAERVVDPQLPTELHYRPHVVARGLEALPLGFSAIRT